MASCGDYSQQTDGFDAVCCKLATTCCIKCSTYLCKEHAMQNNDGITIGVCSTCHEGWQKNLSSATDCCEGNKYNEDEGPKDFTIAASSALGSIVCSVNWMSEQSLACAFYGRVELRDMSLDVAKSHSLARSVLTVCRYGEDFLALVYDDVDQVILFSGDFLYKKTLIKGDFGCYDMAVKENKFLIIDNKTGCVKLYKDDGTHELDFNFTKYMSHACRIKFHNGNSFIVSDYKNGKVLKFKLDEEMPPEWTYGKLKQPTGICADRSGFIYITSWLGKTIHVLKPNGDLLKQFHLPEMLDNPRDISISENYLALASHNGVQLLKISY